VIRLFNVYYPIRLLVLLSGEALIVCSSFTLAALIILGADFPLVLGYESGAYKILAISVFTLVLFYHFDLYDLERLPSAGEVYFRLLASLGLLSLILGLLAYLEPAMSPGSGVFIIGLFILVAGLFAWRATYLWLICKPFFRERIYVVGEGGRARRIVKTLRARPELGMDVVGWAGTDGGSGALPENECNDLAVRAQKVGINRVIVALSNRRGTMPVQELLDLRLRGIQVEDGIALLEKISGKIEVDEIYPSWLIFSSGFRLNPAFLYLRRVISFALSLSMILIFLPFVPLIAFLIKLTSSGPVFYKQKRVGRDGVVFTCYKLRTMRHDAEGLSGAAWATANDTRVTPVGRWLRFARLDELPQLWNVLRGDMAFVGPRPERPEFVESLAREIPYFHVRHIVRPGITGWAQIRHGYGASLEDAREKLKYDLYYLKHMSISLDILIVLQTVKIVLLGRGSR